MVMVWFEERTTCMANELGGGLDAKTYGARPHTRKPASTPPHHDAPHSIRHCRLPVHHQQAKTSTSQNEERSSASLLSEPSTTSEVRCPVMLFWS